MRADKEATPAMRNRPQKLARLRLAEETLFLESIQLFCFPSHAFSIFFIFSPSVTFKTALDTSDTRGEPTGKTCKSLKKKNEKLYTYLSAHERERERELTKPNPSVLYIDSTMVYWEQYCPKKSFM